MVYNTLYHPDAVITMDGVKFIPVEVINSSYGFDTLGILSLVMTKDILDGALIIVTDKMFSQSPEKFSEVKDLISKFNFYSKGVYGNTITFLREHEVESWLTEKVKTNGLWKS